MLPHSSRDRSRFKNNPPYTNKKGSNSRYYIVLLVAAVYIFTRWHGGKTTAYSDIDQCHTVSPFACPPPQQSQDPLHYQKPCNCPSTHAPIPMPPTSTPQFIILSHDNSLSSASVKLLESITASSPRQKNGCPIPITFFVTSADSDCKLVRKRWQQGDEIAVHTINHQHLTPGYDFAKLRLEILGARDVLVIKCGLPKQQVVGFRSPRGHSDFEVRKALYDGGMMYDASVKNLDGGSGKVGVFPFTLHNGMPKDFCTEKTVCKSGENYPGLFELPGHKPSSNTLDLTTLEQQLDAAYYTNRAPLFINLNHNQLHKDVQGNTEALTQYIKHALSLPDVYFVTARQVVEWTKKPTMAEDMQWLTDGCGKPYP